MEIRGGCEADELFDVLADMLEPEGYEAVIREWPVDGEGRARIEVLAHEGASAERLVPKNVLAMIVARKLPVGTRVDSSDLVYPGEA
jgi:hypothetical protein